MLPRDARDAEIAERAAPAGVQLQLEYANTSSARGSHFSFRALRAATVTSERTTEMMELIPVEIFKCRGRVWTSDKGKPKSRAGLKISYRLPFIPSTWMALRWKMMINNVRELRPKPADTEKITINLGCVDLGQIDLLVQEGFLFQSN